jgi:hypothetical protein
MFLFRQIAYNVLQAADDPNTLAELPFHPTNGVDAITSSLKPEATNRLRSPVSVL